MRQWNTCITRSGYLSEIKHNGFSYTMGYDQFGNRVNTKVGNRLLTLNEFANGNGKTGEIHLWERRVCVIWLRCAGACGVADYNGAEAFRYLYGDDGKLASCGPGQRRSDHVQL